MRELCERHGVKDSNELGRMRLWHTLEEALAKPLRKRKTEEAVVEGRMDVEESEAKAVGV